MKARIVLFVVAAIVALGGVTVAAVAIGPSCPSGSYRNGNPAAEPMQVGTIPIPACTSYATHIAPSSGVVIPRYTTYMDPHVGERLAIGIVSLLLGVVLAGLGMAQDRRHKVERAVPVASA
jgi:hypothetical protein